MTRSGAQRARRRELSSVLSHFGLSPRAPVDGRSGDSVRWASALGAFGPLSQAFLWELSARADVLCPEDREAMRSARRRVEPLSVAAIENLVRDEVGGIATDLEVGPETHSTSALFQTQRGTLSSGESVRVKVVRPEIERAVVEDIDTLHLISDRHWIGADGRRVPLELLAEDFLRHLSRRLDLRLERESLEDLAGRSLDLVVPRDFPAYLCRRVAVYEELGEEVSLSSGGLEVRRERARRLLELWLRLALREGLLWENPSLRAIAAQVDPTEGLEVQSCVGTLAIEGGAFVAVDPTTRQRVGAALEAYLLMALRDEPDQTLAAFGELLAATGVANLGHLDELRPQLRQLVPLREHGLPHGRVVARPFDQLPVQWRVLYHEIAVTRGLRFPEAVTAFQRGLVQIVELAERLCDQGSQSEVPAAAELYDGLLTDAVRRYRWRRAAGALARAPAPAGWLQLVRRAAPVLSATLEDVAIAKLPSSGARRGGSVSAPAALANGWAHRWEHGWAHGWIGALAVLLALGGVVLAGDAWRRAGLPPRDLLRLGGLVVLGAVLLLLGFSWWRSRRHQANSRANSRNR